MKKLSPKKQTITLYKALTDTPLVVPYIEEGIKAGFPSPAQDYVKQGIDINQVLIKHPATTFFAKVDGDSQINSLIFNGDFAVVDKSLEAWEGCKVIAVIDGEFALKTVKKIEKDCVYLVPDNPDFPDIVVTPDNDFKIWGVVTHTIHKHN
jgi:DNA polymerase V